MDGEELVVEFAAHEIHFRSGQLHAHGGGQGSTNQEEEKAGDKVLNADDFVIDAEAKKPLPGFGIGFDRAGRSEFCWSHSNDKRQQETTKTEKLDVNSAQPGC